jgi:hypothetical protein
MKLLDAMFGCTCKHYSFPQTKEGKGCYVVCLNCGREYEYDWQTMTRGKSLAELAVA